MHKRDKKSCKSLSRLRQTDPFISPFYSEDKWYSKSDYAHVKGYLICAHYTCDFISILTARSKPESISSFSDVISGGYNVLVMSGGSNHAILKNAKAGTPMNEYYSAKMEGNRGAFVKSNEEALARVAADAEAKTLYFASSSTVQVKKSI